MVRRNLVLITLAVPATAVSATLLSVIDRPGDAPPRATIVSEPVVGKVVAPASAVVAADASAPRAAAKAAIVAHDSASPHAEAEVAEPARAERRAVASRGGSHASVGATVQTAKSSMIVDRPSRKHAQATVGRKASSSSPANPKAKARAASSPSTSPTHATAPRVGSANRSNAPVARLPQGSLAPMAGSELSSADVWEPGVFEPPPLTVVFGEAMPGQPVALALSITNEDSQPEIFACHVAIHAIGDEGESLGEIRPATDITVSVDGDTTAMQNLATIQADELLPWLSQTQLFNVVASGVGQVSGTELTSDNYLYAPVPSIFVTLTSETGVAAGDWVKVTIESDGPLGFALTDAKLRLNGGVQLLQPGQTVFEDGTASDVVVTLGDLATGTSFSHDIWFVAVDPVWAWMSVQLEAPQILPQYNGAGLWDDSWWTDPDEGGDGGGGSDAEPGDSGDGSDGDGGDGE